MGWGSIPPLSAIVKVFLMFKLEYSAPAKDASEFFGVKLYDDWGLIDHAAIQLEILPTHNVGDFWDSKVVERVLSNQRWTDKYIGFQRYHAAMGMVSQYAQRDIQYFIETPNAMRHHQNPDIESEIGYYCQWVMSLPTLHMIKQAVARMKVAA